MKLNREPRNDRHYQNKGRTFGRSGASWVCAQRRMATTIGPRWQKWLKWPRFVAGCKELCYEPRGYWRAWKQNFTNYWPIGAKIAIIFGHTLHRFVRTASANGFSLLSLSSAAISRSCTLTLGTPGHSRCPDNSFSPAPNATNHRSWVAIFPEIICRTASSRYPRSGREGKLLRMEE